MQDAEIFWREESLVRQYIPNYSFVEWRRIRQDYHTIEVCGATLPYLGIDNFDDSMTDTVILDNTYVIIIDVKGETKPFIRPQQCVDTNLNHREDIASSTIREEV